jgi:molybdenum cofactor biosynthesis enzyme MoaA
MSLERAAAFNPAWRRDKSLAFDLDLNSTARGTRELDLFGRRVRIYANANLSIYSAQRCNARCTFCVEELRPASRGGALSRQKAIESSDAAWFDRLEDVLEQLAPLSPSVSITGGEASKDPRLPRLLALLAARRAQKRVLTTNGSGLLDLRDGRRVIDWIALHGLEHLNLSIAHPSAALNARLMRFPDSPSTDALQTIVRVAHAAGVRVRLSCVLLRDGIRDVAGMRSYLDFAASLDIDNVIFRQLMRTDPSTHAKNQVVRYSDQNRVVLEPLLDELSTAADFAFVKQVVGYYYYVEVWRRDDVDVVFEEADLAQLERIKRRDPGTIHELVFHPNAALAATWQPWDGVLSPPPATRTHGTGADEKHPKAAALADGLQETLHRG